MTNRHSERSNLSWSIDKIRGIRIPVCVMSALLALLISGCGGGGSSSGGGSSNTEASDQSVSLRGIDSTFTADPDYVYTYEQTKFVPPDDKVLLIIGQTKQDIIDGYMNVVSSTPGGFASYWGLTTNMLGIIADSPDTGFGVQNAQELITTYENTVLQHALWLVDNTTLCTLSTSGTYDSVIDNYINWVKSINIPVYLRIGYEFDGEHNAYDPVCYKDAYKWIVDRMRSGGVTNVAFVWHSSADTPYDNNSIDAWYPGDDYVDWVAVSVFLHFYPPTSAARLQRLDDVIDFARVHKKPVMIAESAPAGGIVADSYETWDAWFVETFRYMYEKNIKAFSYISADFDSYDGFLSLGWGDARVEAFPLVREQFLLETSKTRYLKQSDTLFGELVFP